MAKKIAKAPVEWVDGKKLDNVPQTITNGPAMEREQQAQ